MIVSLDEDIWFPSPYLGDSNGFFAAGGDLSEPRLMLAYANGIFPWYAYKKETIYWCCPIERFVILPNQVHVSHSMRTLFNKKRFRVVFDGEFVGVLNHCRFVNGRDGEENAWLGQHIVDAFLPLFNKGMAHCVEVFDGDTLIGGLYGTQISGEVFVGESMFSLQPSGSKVALIALARRLAEQGTKIIDCQCHTPHLQSMGGRYMPYSEYISVLHANPKVAAITRYGYNGFLYLDQGQERCLEERFLLSEDE